MSAPRSATPAFAWNRLVLWMRRFGPIGDGVRYVEGIALVAGARPAGQGPHRKPPRLPRTPRVVELLRKALEWQALLESGEVRNQAEVARREGITRARVTQVMGMLRLAPEIQQHVLSLPDMVRRPAISERALRPIAQLENASDQKARFHELVHKLE